jgi:hypothetical protein
MVGNVLYILDYKTLTQNLADCFHPFSVVGESRVSWVLKGGIKVDKETWQVRKGKFEGCQVYTADQMADEMWRQEHVIPIARQVRHIDGATLRKVAAIIGYKAPEPPPAS